MLDSDMFNIISIQSMLESLYGDLSSYDIKKLTQPEIIYNMHQRLDMCEFCFNKAQNWINDGWLLDKIKEYTEDENPEYFNLWSDPEQINSGITLNIRNIKMRNKTH